jgi:hypothetical protein
LVVMQLAPGKVIIVIQKLTAGKDCSLHGAGLFWKHHVGIHHT